MRVLAALSQTEETEYTFQSQYYTLYRNAPPPSDPLLSSPRSSERSLSPRLCTRSVTSVVSDLCDPITVAAHGQASLSMAFPRQEHWSELPFPFPGELRGPGIEPPSPASPVGGFFTAEPPRKPHLTCVPSAYFYCWNETSTWSGIFNCSKRARTVLGGRETLSKLLVE